MKIYRYIIVALVAFSAIGFALGSGSSLSLDQSPPVSSNSVQSSSKSKPDPMVDNKNPFVDLTADVIMQRAARDSTIYFIGNVAFHHNGAIIQCDSAARYTNSDKMDFFGKVIIYKDSAYIYGDKVSYDAKNNMAEVFSPLVKMLRGDVTLYTYHLNYNTKTNIAYFNNGGIMNKGSDSYMESYRGEFDADRNIVKFLDSVSMRSKDYDIKTDSLTYSVDNEVVTFLTHTYIWDKDSSIMEANKGFYFTQSETYEFFDSAYLVSKEREMWADTMDYYAPMRQATMRKNVQILDTANRTIALGDWAFYDDSLGVAILTKMPSVRSYNEDKSDTTYMRSDTIYMTTYEVKSPILDSLPMSDSIKLTNLSTGLGDSLMFNDSVFIADIDSLELARSVSKRDSVLNEHPSAEGMFNQIIQQREDNLQNVASLLETDSTQVVSLPETVAFNDSLPVIGINLPIDSLLKTAISPPNDTLYTITKERIIRAYYNVRMWSKDNQAICDSVIAFSADSVAQMHGNPIIWNENNQITSNQVNAYSSNEKLDWVEFIGDPFIVQKVEPQYPESADTARYNQASGKEMFVYFTNNEVDSLILSGNVINYYYMESDGYTSSFTTIECANLVVFFEDRVAVKMRWEGKSDWNIYPLNKIPKDQSERISGFTWQPEKRPMSAKEISDRELKLSRRESVLAEPLPTWIIEQRINSYKEILKKSGSWTDRTDVNTITVDYFDTQNQML